MKNFVSIISLLLFLSVLFSCKKHNLKGHNSKFGTVEGTIYTPNKIIVKGASINLIGFEDTYQTKSDSLGKFSIEIPVGNQKLKIHTGSGEIFSSTIQVFVESNNTTKISSDKSVLNLNGNLACVPGEFDSIEFVIGALGYQIDIIDTTELNNLNILTPYDVIFLNCGHYRLLNIKPNQINNLENYLLQGGNIYATDHAIAYFAQSCDTGFYQNTGFMPESLVCSSSTGNDYFLNGNVINQDLKSIIGLTANIYYDKGNWLVSNIDLNDSRVNILIEENDYGPLAFEINWGNSLHSGGKVAYTNFHHQVNMTSDMNDLLEWFILNF